MRFDGKLVKWNDDRGFGFVVAAQGGQEVFVHVSAYPVGQRPRVGELLSFEVELNKDGKKRAVNVQRLYRAGPVRSDRGLGRPSRKAGGLARGFVTIAILVALGAYAYNQYARRSAAYAPAKAEPLPQNTPALVLQAGGSNFRCDGRTYCSQMSSCAEATFFLKNCPGTKMDGNHDGVPCEEQWCTGPLAK